MKKILLLIFIVSLGNQLHSQNTFNILFNYLNNQVDYDFCIGLDKSIVVAGTKSQQLSQFGMDGLFIAKLDSNGQMLYKKAYDTLNNSESIRAITTTSDSGFVCVGSSMSWSISGAGSDIWVCKLDKNGNLIWSRTIDSGLSPDGGQDVIEAPDGGVIISGTADYGTGALSGDIYMLKLSATGSLLWKKKIGIQGTNQEGKFLARANNYFYVSGFYGVYATTQAQTVVARVDYNGNILWQKEFDVTGNYNATLGGISTTIDGGCLIATSNSLAKVDSNGLSVWSYFYSSSQGITISKIIELSNGMYLGMGSVLAKFDQNMNLLWMKQYINTLDMPFELKEMNNSYIFISKSNSSVNNFSAIGTLIKTDSNGNTNCNSTSIPLPYLVLTVNPPTITNKTSVISTLGYIYNQSTNLLQSTPTTFIHQCGGYDAGISQIISPLTSTCNSLVPLTVQVKNFSNSVTLPTVNIGYNLNGIVANQTYNFQILPNADTILSLGNINLNTGINNLKVWATYDPILTYDNNVLNDTSYTVINNNGSITPTIVALSNTTFCNGGQVVLNCNNNTTGPFQWYKNNVLISGATNQQYIASASGSYKLYINNTVCIDSSNAIIVTVNNPSSSTVSHTACNSYTLNNQTYTTTGTYTQTILNTLGCDSVITLNLTINSLSATITQNANVLSASPSGGSYQWVKCPSYTIIPNAINQVYTATENASYAVIITANGCTDTSNCIAVTGVATQYILNSENITIAPNPIKNNIIITSSKIFKKTSFKIFTTTGECVIRKNISNTNIINIDMSFLPKGLYFIDIIDDSNYKYRSKIIKD